ncbi:hypothetical protein CDAR_311261 [Caerostris darwini]|uniref:Uncharacterized protein n=1 Tax=Caerostris darwini TaxID=1538125 RepID=A0AAV4USZ6_9ARAC|nr:hypothetical protein CDAR_311261 [Caerostris darwini]
MKILDDIIATTKNSDLQSDYDQMKANLMQKRQLLAEWASRVPCPLAYCNIHDSNVKKSKRPVTELTNQNDKTNAAQEFKTPNKKRIAKANFSPNTQNSVDC